MSQCVEVEFGSPSKTRSSACITLLPDFAHSMNVVSRSLNHFVQSPVMDFSGC